MLHGVTRDGMIEVDRIMTEDLQIPVSLMMENAGLHLARLVTLLNPDNKHIIVICGTGNNGGGGLVAARRLANWGCNASIFLPKGRPKTTVAKKQYERAINCGIEQIGDITGVDNTMLVDALIGYNFCGALRSDIIDSVELMRNNSTVSLDIPTGIDSSTGQNVGDIDPIATLVLAFPKSGMHKLENEDLGNTFLADIGIPKWVFHKKEIYDGEVVPTTDKLDLLYSNFNKESVVPITINSSGWELK